jgi:hypothetical protein
LPDAFGLQQIAQPVLAEIAQGHGRGWVVVDQRSRRVGEHDLAAMGNREEPAQPVERGHLLVVARGAGHGLAGVQRHAHPDRRRQRPGFSGNRLLRLNGGAKRVMRRGEGSLHRVAGDLVAMPTVGGNRRVEQLQMAVDRETHRLRVPLPERGALLDVGEEEGNRPTRELGHDPSQCLRSVVLFLDCRMPSRCWSRRSQDVGQVFSAVIRAFLTIVHMMIERDHAVDI